MRIVFVLSGLSGGGAERVAVNVMNQLAGRHEIILALYNRSGPYLASVSAEIDLVDLQDEPVRLPSRPRSIRKWLRPAWQLRSALQRLTPDLIVSFLPEGSLPVSLARRVARDRLGTWLVVEQNHTRRRTIETNPNPLRRLVQDRWIRVAYGRADYIVAASRGVKQGLIDDYGIDKRAISVIYNPMDLAAIRAGAAATPLVPLDSVQRPLLVTAGRLTYQKGIDLLLRALAQLRQSIPASLVVLGVGELERDLRTLAADLGVANAVHFVGFQDNPWSIITQADLFVLASRWEGFGNVIVEAMACGTPVVATDCRYGPGEIIRHSESGLLTPVEDPAALAAAMRRVLDDPSLARALRDGGRRRAEAFAIGRISDQYDALFQQLTNPIM